MRKVHKYEISGRLTELIVEPSGEILHIGFDGNEQLCVWIMIDTRITGKSDVRRFGVYGTGEDLPDVGRYIGTVRDSRFIWHILELDGKEKKMSQKVSIGRMVHYQGHGSLDGKYQSETMPAIVTKVGPDDTCRLFVISANGVHFDAVSYSECPRSGFWSWPPRV